MSGICTPIRLGYNNRTPYATMTSSPAPSTPINFIKDEWKSRSAYWPEVNSEGNIVITGRLSSPQNSEFLALPDISQIGYVEMKLELYLEPDSTKDILEMPWTDIVSNNFSGLIPLGDWTAGVDAYGIPVDGNAGALPETFIHWFGARHYYDGFKLTIRASPNSSEPLSNVKMRMLFMGDMFQFDECFSLDNAITFLTPPQLAQTSSGSWVNTRRQNRSRKIDLSLDHMTDRDRNELYQFESKLLGQAFILSAFPSSDIDWQFNNYNMLARFGTNLKYIHKFAGIHKTDITFLEV